VTRASAKPIKTWHVDALKVEVYETREEMGRAAAALAAQEISKFARLKPVVNIVFAAAPSQNEFLDFLVVHPGIDWARCYAFHLDEYLDLPVDAPQKFANYLKHRVFEKVNIGRVYYVDDGTLRTPEEICERYAKLLEEHPIDIAFLGIGENGHLAFNDPPVADFDDPLKVKIVTIDEVSRNQQVHDGCFNSVEEVPREAVTITIPTIMAAKVIICVVPGRTKQEAVRRTLQGPISPACPASILRRHSNATLFLDVEAAKLVLNERKGRDG